MSVIKIFVFASLLTCAAQPKLHVPIDGPIRREVIPTIAAGSQNAIEGRATPIAIPNAEIIKEFRTLIGQESIAATALADTLGFSLI